MPAAEIAAVGKDSATPTRSAVSQSGAQLFTQEQILLADIFEGATLDTSARWASPTLANGGTVTQADATGLTLATSTNTAGSAILQSALVVPYLACAEVSIRASVRMGTVGVSGNSRELGLRVDGSNYIEYLLNGSDWVTRVQSGGSTFAADYPITGVRADDLVPMDLEIRIQRSPDRVSFIYHVDGQPQQIQSYAQRGIATRLFQGALAQVYARTLNSGSAVDNTMILHSLVVSQRWNAPGQNIIAKKMTADGIVCRGPALYYGMCRATATGGAAIMYNNTSAAGTIVDQYDASMVSRNGPWAAPIFCYSGLYLDLTTDNVVVYFLPV